MAILARLSHYFLPQESNNHKAKILHSSSLSSIIVFFLLLQAIFGSLSFAKPAVLGFASQISPEKIVELTNLERTKVGAAPLTLNQTLNQSALRKAGDMFAFNYWAHNSPSGRDPWSFFKEVGYKYLYAGENLARDFSSPEDVVNAWMASSSHRENLLNPKYKEIGISVVDGTLDGADTTLVVQHFGTTSGSRASLSSGVRTVEKVKAPVPVVSVQPVTIPVTSRAILSQARGNEKILINPFTTTQILTVLLLTILAGSIIVDGLIVYRRKIFRLSGRSFAHFLFLAAAIMAVLLTKQGAVL